MWRIAALCALALLGACGGTAQPDAPAPAPGPGDARPAAPWSAAPLARGAVPDVYPTAWSAAENRTSCALIAPASVEPQATARRATFSGGWGVAYDTPQQRSAFGVAGTGATFGPDTYDEWPHRIEWRDGSSAGYGPEGGGAGPNQLAYLRIAGQSCLYNVWSRLGVDHLERLLASLRFVSE